MKNFLPFLTILLTTLASVQSCDNFRKREAPGTEYSAFIKAYTGDVVHDGSPIRIELASPAETMPEDETLFDFSPSIKGKTHFLSPSTIEFVPEPGEIKPGRSYNCSFNLGKTIRIKDRRLRKFKFSFVAATREAEININRVIISQDSPGTATVEGTIALNSTLEAAKVREMISCRYEGSSPEVEITGEDKAASFGFAVKGLPRGRKDMEASIRLKTGDTGFRSAAANAVIPGTDTGFRVMSAERKGGENPHVDIQFSNPLVAAEDYRWFFNLEGSIRYSVQAENNIVRIHYEGAKDKPVTLNISGAVQSSSGVRLGEPFVRTFLSEEPKPAVEIPLKGSILPDAKELVLPFKAVSLKAVDLQVIKIYEDNILTFLQTNSLEGGNEIRRSGRLVYKKTIRLDTEASKDLHRWQEFAVDLSGLFRQESGAIYRIRLSFKQDYSVYGKTYDKTADAMVELGTGLTPEDIAVWDSPFPYYYGEDFDWGKYSWKDRDDPETPSYYMDTDRFPSCNLMTSDIGLIAKYSEENRIWVAASNVISAKPIYGVEVEVYDYQLRLLGKGSTDSDGFAEIELSGVPFVLKGKKNGVTSYLKITEDEENQLSRFDVGGKKLSKGLKGFIYGERGIWRPGDTLHVMLLVRDKAGKLPDTHPAVMELYNPQGQFYTRMTRANAVNGFYRYDIPTLQTDPTGVWNAYFKLGGATFHKPLHIESIKPNRLKINMDIGAETLAASSRVPIAISSSWLTGPAASGLNAKASMTLFKSKHIFKGFEEYEFVNPASDFSSSEHQILNTRLDLYGRSSTAIEMPEAASAPGMLAARILCSVEEKGGDESFISETLPFSPFSAYVGIKGPSEDKDGWIETDKEHSLRVATVDKDGKRVSGHNIEYRIFKLKWSWWWESRAEAFDSYVNGNGADAVASGKFISGGSDALIPFRVDYPEWGRYFVYVKDADSGHATGSILHVDWPAYRGRSGKVDPDALTMLSFSTDKKSYEIGETVTVYIPGATGGRALVSIENASTVLSREWVSAAEDGGDAKYTFKATREMSPNCYIHISLVQPHKKTGNDLPIRLYGVMPIMVEDKDSRIEPIISMADKVHPEEEFTVRVREKKGRPMTYTIAIVDEGLLDITSFKTPDPWHSMYEKEALGVRTWDLYDRVIGSGAGRFSTMLSIGGDEELRHGVKKDNRFNPVVKFVGPFALKSGEAVHKVKLPMYVGSVRVMVTAGQDGAFGSANKTVPVVSPIMVLATLPRFLGSGEKVTLPVNVFAMEDGIRKASVSVSTEGPLKITGRTKEDLSFDKQGDKMAYFSLEATGEGFAKVSVNADAGGIKAKETIVIEIKNPNPVVSSLYEAVIEAGGSEEIRFTKDETGEEGKAVMELAGFPAINFNGGFVFFDNYRYTCTEQTVAKGIFLLNVKGMLSQDNAEKVDAAIGAILHEVYSRQLGNGGFSYFPGIPDANGWITSMAGQFLIGAEEAGFEVNKAIKEGWMRFQRQAVKSHRPGSDDLGQAYRLYTLALASAPDHAAMNRLKESERLPITARTMLASAYAICGKTNIAKDLLETTGEVPDEGAREMIYFGSELRNSAIDMEALVLTGDTAMALAKAQDIAAEFNSGYYSTQEAAFVSTAMKRLADKTGSDIISAEIITDGKTTVAKTPKSTYSQTVESESGHITVRNLSESTLHASLAVTGRAPAGKPVPAQSNGLRLSAEYFSNDGTPLDPSSVRQGTDFTVAIKVTNPNLGEDLSDLALRAGIPSGWEIRNDRIVEPVASQNAFIYNDIRDDGQIWYFNLERGTSKTFRMKLRAAYEGEYTLPAVTCEAMYDTHTSACTASGQAKVIR